MKHIARNLFLHENGGFYALWRESTLNGSKGRQIMKSLRTTTEAHARQRIERLRLLGMDWTRFAAAEFGPCHCPPIATPAAAQPERRPRDSDDGRPSFSEAVELHFERQSFASGDSERSARQMKKIVLTFCSDWSGFDPQLIWKRYKERRGPDGRKDTEDIKTADLVAAPNQLRWYLRKLVPWLVKKQWLSTRALEELAEIKNLKVNPRHPEIPTKEQIRELFCQIDLEDPELGRFLKFVAMTGQRRGRWHPDREERRGALGISWSDVDLTSHRIRVTLKGNFVKWLFISDEAVLLLQELAQERKENSMPDDQIWGFSDRKAKRASALLRKWCEAFHLEMDYLHALRHYFCSVGLSEGLSAAEVAQLAGHKDNGKLLLSVYAHVLQPVLEKKVRGFSVIQ